MEKNYKFVIVIGVLCFLLGGAVTFIICRAYSGIAGRAGSEFSAAGDLNRNIADEQRASLSGVERSIEALERIRGITTETNSSLRKLGVANRGSSDISALIREETNILADYFRDVGNELDNYHSDFSD